MNVRWFFVVLIATVFVRVPFLQGVFGTAGLSVQDWLTITGLAFTVVPVLEIGKWRMR